MMPEEFEQLVPRVPAAGKPLENSRCLLALCEVFWARSKELITPGINSGIADPGGSAPAAAQGAGGEAGSAPGGRGGRV